MVTAIITTYKRPAEIVKRAAESVLNQTHKDLELIIVDDSPSDYELRADVRKMAEDLGERVRYIPHEKNMGACAARNTGLQNAKGEFVAYLDDDDEWLPEKIEKQLDIMRKNNNVALVYCGRYTYWQEQKKLVNQKVCFLRGYVFDELFVKNFIGSTSFPLIRKSVIEKLGGFDVKLPAAQDYEMWLRMAKENEVDYVKEPLVKYYVHPGEQITKNYRAKSIALERIYDLNSDYLKKKPKTYARKKMLLAWIYADHDIKKGRKLFWESLKTYPCFNKEFVRAVKHLYYIPFVQSMQKK